MCVTKPVMQSTGPGGADAASALLSNLPPHTSSCCGFTLTTRVPRRARERLGPRTGEQPGLIGLAGKSK